MAAVNEYDLITAIQDKTWLKMPLAVMQDVGPAVQSFGGLLKVTAKETFVSVEKIAARSGLPVWTCRKHLATLQDRQWITNSGRRRTRNGGPRRTCTIRIPEHTKRVIEPYSILPWWALWTPERGEALSWSSKAVLSLVMSRLAGLIKTIEEQDGKADIDQEDVWGSIANLNGDDSHFLFSRRSVEDQTGLDPKSITKAKGDLANRGIVKWTKFTRPDGGDCRHSLEPREEFRVRVKSPEKGPISIEWLRGGKSGK